MIAFVQHFTTTSNCMENDTPTDSLLAGGQTAGPLTTLAVELVKYVAVSAIGLIWRTEPLPAGPKHPNAFITGCDIGIGRAVALRLASQGWRVFAGVYTEAGWKLSEESSAITAIPLDVTRPESVAAAAAEVAAAVGADGLQLLVNNAGIGMLAPAECMPLQEYKRMYEVNVFGVLSTTQAFLPLLRAGQRKGRIITMSSVAGHLSMAFWAGYSGSKHAVEALCDCLRYELAPQGIAVVLVKPGPVRTAIWDSMGSKEDALGRILTSPEMKQLYGDDYTAMLHEADKAGKAGIPVADVVDVIVEAATCRSPKGRYHVGPNAAAFHWLRRLVPDEAWFNTMNKVMTREYKRGRASPAAGAPGGPLHEKAM